MALPLYYNVRNLAKRKLSTMLTFVVVALVVFVLAALFAFAAGIRASLDASGSPRNVLVLKPGATAESTSLLMPDEVAKLVPTPGVARDAGGRPLLSPELCIQTAIPRRGPDALHANVAVRGVDEIAFRVHPEVQIVAGRPFTPGAMEIIVGKAAQERYLNLNLGDTLELGRLSNRQFKVVGVFEARGGALESEIWGPRTLLADVYLRRFDSSAVLRLADGADAAAAMSFINGPAVELQARLETAYYEELAKKTREIVLLATVLIGIMGMGAAFAVANTMFSAVDGRRREIAMLRTMGFQRGAIVLAFLMESMLICSAACAVGLGASMFLNGSRQDFLSDTTWTVLAYELRVTPGIAGAALLVAVVVAAAGAAAPAIRASRIRVIEALRKA